MASRGHLKTSKSKQQLRHEEVAGNEVNGKATSKHRRCKGKKLREKEEERRNQEKVGAWGCLPPEVAQRILLLLPQHHIPSVLSVCREWHDFLQHRSHLHRRGVGETLSPIFISMSPIPAFRSWIGYHADSGRWTSYSGPAFFPFPISRVHSSHRGLLLVEVADSQPASALYLCNFSTHTHSQLPSCSLLDPADDGIVDPRYRGWYRCHLQVDGSEADIAAGVHSFRVIGLLESKRNDFGWPEIVCFDSRKRNWNHVQVPASSLRFTVLAAVNESVILQTPLQGSSSRSMMSIYVVAPKKNSPWYNYLFKYEPVTSTWLSVAKVPHVSVEIVTFRDTLMAIVLDQPSRRILLYRLVMEQSEQDQYMEDGKERLVLEACSGPELADFVNACVLRSWYTSSAGSPSSRSRLYIGIRLSQEAIALSTQGQQPQHPWLVEYDGFSETWRSVPLPKDMLDLQKYFSNATNGVILYGDAYHELGLITMPESFD